jgi:phage baseplate assembly protein V
VNGYSINELDRRVANMIRLGTIADVEMEHEDADGNVVGPRAQVNIGDDEDPILTEWLPWLVQRAGKTKTWWAPDVGEQVAILSPGGEMGQGLILGAIFQPGTAGFEPNGDELDVQRITLDPAGKYEIAVGADVMLHIESGQVKAGNGATEAAARADRVDARLDALEAAYNGHVHQFTDVTPGGPVVSSTLPTSSTASGTSTAADEVKIK